MSNNNGNSFGYFFASNSREIAGFLPRLITTLENLTGTNQNFFRDRQTEHLRGHNIDHKIEFDRLFHWQISRLDPTQNLVDEIASTAEQIRKVRAVRDRTYSRKEFIVGSFSPIAKILMRTRFVLIRGSVHTYSASARSLSDSMAESTSSVFVTPSLTSSPSLGAASSAAFISKRMRGLPMLPKRATR